MHCVEGPGCSAIPLTGFADGSMAAMQAQGVELVIVPDETGAAWQGMWLCNLPTMLPRHRQSTPLLSAAPPCPSSSPTRSGSQGGGGRAGGRLHFRCHGTELRGGRAGAGPGPGPRAELSTR